MLESVIDVVESEIEAMHDAVGDFPEAIATTGESEEQRQKSSPKRRSKLTAPRWSIAQNQLAQLQEIFKTVKAPSLAVRQMLGRQMGVSPRQIQVWFRNRRQRVRLAKLRGEPDPSETDIMDLAEEDYCCDDASDATVRVMPTLGEALLGSASPLQGSSPASPEHDCVRAGSPTNSDSPTLLCSQSTAWTEVGAPAAARPISAEGKVAGMDVIGRSFVSQFQRATSRALDQATALEAIRASIQPTPLAPPDPAFAPPSATVTPPFASADATLQSSAEAALYPACGIQAAFAQLNQVVNAAATSHNPAAGAAPSESQLAALLGRPLDAESEMPPAMLAQLDLIKAAQLPPVQMDQSRFELVRMMQVVRMQQKLLEMQNHIFESMMLKSAAGQAVPQGIADPNMMPYLSRTMWPGMTEHPAYKMMGAGDPMSLPHGMTPPPSTPPEPAAVSAEAGPVAGGEGPAASTQSQVNGVSGSDPLSLDEISEILGTGDMPW
uniref:Homeobox domain-containing protein n=1 Tax=Haptolina brevifila TaxID=156173 RepID=A0A7S2DSA2_9EUKA|mmetsp:Transcript_43057/g.86292  ORF Transcript_43057/g.86292 Transcript_43057/m.86292 type:complete len:494 (+) Transcript_43057:38-1519(+)